MAVDVSHARVESTDGVVLHRWIVRPESTKPWARLLVVHGYGDHAGRYLHVMRFFADRGVACSAVDFRGHGVSAGRRGFISRFDDQVDDLRAVLATPDLAEPRRPDGPLFVLAHSNGGLVTTVAAARGLFDCAGVILSAPYLRQKLVVPVAKRLLGMVGNIACPWLTVPSGLGGEMMTSDEAMQADSRSDPLVLRCATPRWYAETTDVQRTVLDLAPTFALPLLCFAGDRDPIADAETSRAFVEQAASADKRFEILPGRLHEPLRDHGREALMEMIAGWMRDRSTPMRTAQP